MTMEASAGGGAAAPSPAPSTQQPAVESGPSISDQIGRGSPEDNAPDPVTGKPRERKPKEEAPDTRPKYKLRVGEVEEELPGDELVKRLSDDYEHEIPGPGGKPWRGTRAEMVRMAQRGLGAEMKMREAAAIQKRLADMDEAGKQDVPAYLHERLGIEDPEEWIRQAARQLFQRDQRVMQLMQSQDANERWEGFRMQTELANAVAARKGALAKKLDADAAAQREQQQNVAARKAQAQEVFKAARVPFNAETEAIGQKIWTDHFEATGLRMTDQEVAAAVKREYTRARRAELEALADEDVFPLLGDKLRERLRALELAAIKGAKAAAKAAEPEKKDTAAESRRPKPGEDERDWRKRIAGMK